MKSRFVFALVVLSIAALARPAPPAVPSTQPRPVFDGKTWQLGWAHGTAEQVGDQINGDVRRLTVRCGETRRLIEEQRQELARLNQACLSALHAGAARPTQDEIAAVTVQLEAARASHDSAAAISLSSKLNHARRDLAQMEAAAIAADPRITRSGVLLRDQEEQLRKLSAALSDARQWRGKMVEALRNSLLIHWPLYEKEIGLLGETKSTDSLRAAIRQRDGRQVADLMFDKTVLAYGYEWGDQTEEHESITTNKVVSHPFLLECDGPLPSADTAVQIVVLDENPPAATELGHAVCLVAVIACPDHPFSQLMRAIDTP